MAGSASTLQSHPVVADERLGQAGAQVLEIGAEVDGVPLRAVVERPVHLSDALDTVHRLQQLFPRLWRSASCLHLEQTRHHHQVVLHPVV